MASLGIWSWRLAQATGALTEVPHKKCQDGRFVAVCYEPGDAVLSAAMAWREMKRS